MKKRTLLVMAATLSLIAAAQPRKWSKMPMSDFRNDTVAYIRHNFNPDDKNMQEYFKGRTLGEIILELGFKVKYLSASRFNANHDITAIMLVGVSKGNKNGEFETTNGVSVWFATPITPKSNSAAYNQLMSQTDVPFNKDLFDLIKEMKMNYIKEDHTLLIERD